MSITITCHNRLMPWLLKEVQDLGYVPEETFVTGLRLKGSMDDCVRLNLNLRCASQILYSLKAFTANNADDVYEAASDIPWEDILPMDAYFSVTSNVQNDTINNSLFANLRVKDAIVDRLQELRGSRPDSGPDLSGAVVHLHWKNDIAQLFLDTTGPSLARHGYRKLPGRAPMLEALAAATILASSWDRASPFINPMCGSGTLAIEAALIATNTRPGVFRTNYAFMHLLDFDEDQYLKERGKVEQQIISPPRGLEIVATDFSKTAIENTQKNAKAAGISEILHAEICDFTQTPIPEGKKGVVFFNPEYGERLGDEQELLATYQNIGDFMKQKCGGYFGYIFTGNMILGKRIGLKPKRKIEFYNATIDCRLLEYELYEGTRR